MHAFHGVLSPPFLETPFYAVEVGSQARRTAVLLAWEDGDDQSHGGNICRLRLLDLP